MTTHIAKKIESVLIVRSAFGDLYEPAWLRALRDLGIKTELFDTHRYFPNNLVGRMERRYLCGPHIEKVNRLVVERVKEMRPDAALFYQGHHYTRETIEQVAKLTFAAGAHCDDPFGRRDRREYRLLLDALPAYDGYHVNRKVNVLEAEAYGIKHVAVLMLYYLPWLHYPGGLTPQQQQEWGSDMAYTGHVESDLRVECFSRVVREGFKCRIFGDEKRWRDALPSDVYDAIGTTRKISPADCRLALCASKIGACFFSKWNRDQYSHRSWEIPACGLFLLSERTAAMQEFYEEGKEAGYFDSSDEFMDKTRFYIRNDSARQRIANAGYKRVTTSGYDIYSRMRQWLSDVSEWRKQKLQGNG